MTLSGRRVLVTGADGFIGSHLVEALVERGANVRALALYNSFNHLGWLEQVGCKQALDIVTGDIRDPVICRDITNDIDVVFHLAALIAIPYSYRAPQSYFETNVLGTLNICQACRDNSVSRLLHTSTSEVYGTALYVPIDEKHPLQPQSPYSASKIGADAAAKSFFLCFGLPLTVVRPFNTYGPRQSARAVIPSIITQIAAGCPSISIGDVTPTRDFNYVADTCQGFISIAESDRTIGEEINIGSNTEITIENLFFLIRELMGREVSLVTEEARLRPEKSEVRRLWCDNTRIRELTGFKAQFPLREGLKRTIEWFTKPENLLNYKVGVYNV
ncbi:MAG: SDR family NAD(P)-dependent oxidoreductase [Acidobacteria bacterium]|nr:MAG: SDR family NAD(P)-dependent oxidoreductase [Acidobacteriota bacterium]